MRAGATEPESRDRGPVARPVGGGAEEGTSGRGSSRRGRCCRPREIPKRRSRSSGLSTWRSRTMSRMLGAYSEMTVEGRGRRKVHGGRPRLASRRVYGAYCRKMPMMWRPSGARSKGSYMVGQVISMQRDCARDGRTWRHPRRARRNRWTGRCAWLRHAAGRGFRGGLRKSGRPSSARFILSDVPSTRKRLMEVRGTLGRGAGGLHHFKEGDFGVEVGGDDGGVEFLAVGQGDSVGFAVVANQNPVNGCDSVRTSAPLAARRRGDRVRHRAHAAFARSPINRALPPTPPMQWCIRM